MNERELIYTSVLNCTRSELYLKTKSLSPQEQMRISNILEKRRDGFPLQYLLGTTEFMGLEFKVKPGVFIPRPETEILVETAIKFIRNHNVLDIGTGSGCIAISLKKFLPHTDIIATDISQKTLEVARENAILNNVKINFLLSNLFKNSELRSTNYELIVSNPPYIPSAEIDNLPPEVKCEPRMALDGGKDGLDFYRRIIKDGPQYLKDEGLLIMEMGFRQYSAIKEIFIKSGKFEIIEVVKDYSGIDRVIVAKNISNKIK